MEPGPSGTSKASAQISGQSDTDITADFLQPLLTPDNVANLVRMVGGPFPTRQGGKVSSLFPAPPLHPAHLFQMTPDLTHFSVLRVGSVSSRGPSSPWMDLFLDDIYSFRMSLVTPLPNNPSVGLLSLPPDSLILTLSGLLCREGLLTGE